MNTSNGSQMTKGSRSQMFLKKDVLNFDTETPVLESLLNKVKKRLQYRCFLVKIANFLRTPSTAASDNHDQK